MEAFGGEKESFGRKIYKNLMNGVSHMLPFVIGGGILIALAFLFDGANAGTDIFGTGNTFSRFFKDSRRHRVWDDVPDSCGITLQ